VGARSSVSTFVANVQNAKSQWLDAGFGALLLDWARDLLARL
jgi:hypothetical protein